MRQSYRSALAGWFLLTTLLLTAIGGVVHHSISGFIEDTNWVTHTHMVLERLSDTLLSLVNAESAQRGFVVTGKSGYLALYYAARPHIRDNLEQLEELTSDNREQRDRAAKLKPLIETRFSILEKIVGLREKSFDAAQRLMMTDTGKQQMEAVRADIQEMTGRERHLLVRRKEAAEAAARQTMWVSGGGIGLCCLLLMAMLNGIRREAVRREAAEAGLQAANREMKVSLETMRRLTREASLLGTMGDMLQSCRSLDEAHSVVGRTLPQLFPEAGGALCLINASQNLVEAVRQWGPGGESEQAIATQALFAPEECWALRRGRLHIVQDARTGQLCQHLGERHPGSCICVPLAALGETLGLLYLEEPASDAWNPEREQVARNAAEQISLALANLKLQETLRTQSIRDPLTGLFNRRYLEASLERELARSQRYGHEVGVLMMDIDHFKRFNDTFGHEAGDMLLAEFGNTLRRFSRDEDIACRYGGEEFTLILPGADLDSARTRAEQLRERAGELHIEYRRQPLGKISISIGVATFPRCGENGDEVLRAADEALYRAKREGRDRVILADCAAGERAAMG